MVKTNVPVREFLNERKNSLNSVAVIVQLLTSLILLPIAIVAFMVGAVFLTVASYVFKTVPSFNAEIFFKSLPRVEAQRATAN